MHKSIYLNDINAEVVEILSDLNLDSVITSQSRLNAENLSKLKSLNIEVYGKVTCFEGQPLLDKFPDAQPVTHDGKETTKDWYVGICPTHEGVRAEIKSRIDSLIELDVDGIWLQFLHYPTKWDETDPVIMDTCYCDRCVSKFRSYTGDEFEYSDMEELFLLIDGSYYQEWLDFKAKQISSIVEYARKKIDASGKSIKLAYFTPPWDESEHRAALQRVLAQERTLLTPLVDVTSPMLYYKKCGESVDWIKAKVEYFWNLGAEFLPIVEVADVDSVELKTSLEYAVESPSSGVCINTFDNLLAQKEKLKTVREFFTALN